MKNRFEVKGDITIIHLQHGKKTIIDTTDLPRAQEFPNTWTALRGYVVGKICIGRGKSRKVILHRWLMQPAPGMLIDHINHNGFDNRRSNLREVTQSENQQNRKQPIGRTGYRGVYKKGNGYKVEVTVYGKRIYLGYYSDPETAAIVAAEARRRLMPCTQETLLLKNELEREKLWKQIREQFIKKLA
ncbi:MAG TPA: hypothetical protein GXX46_02065 [Peptococcaceae bacterium]|nr:hypothetical protein [Peptococcaceae bacterium]